MRKLLIFLSLIFSITILSTTPAFAGEWQSYAESMQTYSDIVQSSDGTIYRAHNTYLERWNGSAFETLGSFPYNEPYHTYDIFDIEVDKNNKIWAIGYDSGYNTNNLAYYQNGSWVKIGDMSGSDDVKCLTVDNDGYLWLGTEDGNIYKYTGSSFQKKATLVSGEEVTSIFCTNDGKIWAYCYNAVYSYSDASGLKKETSLSNLKSVIIDANNNCYGTDGTKIYKYNNGSWVDLNIPSQKFVGLAISPDGSIVASTGDTSSWTYNGDIRKYNGTTWDILYSWSSRSDSPAIASKFIIDKEGSIWACGGHLSGRYKFSNSPLSVIPASNGATGNLVVRTRFDGLLPGNITLQLSTDGANFTDAATITNGSDYVFKPTANNYWFRFKWLWKANIFTSPQAKYTNVVGPVPAISTNVTVTTQTGVVQWDKVRGRSWVKLSWNSVPNATNYRLYVFDGNTYRAKDLGNVTSWDSRTAKIFPFPDQLVENNTVTTDLFRWDGSGLDFEDSALRLYRTTSGTQYDTNPKYWFRVVATNAWMETDFNSVVINIQLPEATDTTPPTGTITVTSSDGLSKTGSQDVKVNITANDTQSGLGKVELSNDGITWVNVPLPINNPISWKLTPGAGTKIVQLRLTDMVGNQYVTSASIVLTDDILPPSVTLSLPGGATSTTSSVVKLLISVNDNVSIPSQIQMSFSNDGNLWSPWEPYQESKDWDITNSAYGGVAGAGTKTVYCRVTDEAQNIGRAILQIGYNPTPPTTNAVTITGGITGTFKGKNVIFINSDLPTLTITATGASQMRYDAGLGVWSDWEPFGTSRDIVLNKSSGTCLVRVQVQDAYGITSAPYTQLVVIDNTPPTLKVSWQGGATITNASHQATLQTVVSDDISPAANISLAYSKDGTNYTNFTGSTVTITFSTTVKYPTVYVKATDQAGNQTVETLKIFVQ